MAHDSAERMDSSARVDAMRRILVPVIERVRARRLQARLGWLVSGILLVLWFVLSWSPSVLLGLIGLQLLIATAPGVRDPS
jgi:hypothetical protein